MAYATFFNVSARMFLRPCRPVWLSVLLYVVTTNQRAHLDVDTVELVEARPRPLLREARKESPHDLVVEPVRAVEDDTVYGQGLRQILSRFRLPCISRMGRSSGWWGGVGWSEASSNPSPRVLILQRWVRLAYCLQLGPCSCFGFIFFVLRFSGSV